MLFLLQRSSDESLLLYKIAITILVVLLAVLVAKLIVDAKHTTYLKEQLVVYDESLKRQGVTITQQKDQIRSFSRSVDAVLRSELSSIRRNENQLLAALKTANLGFWEWNTMNDQMIFNDNFYSMLGYTPGSLETTTATFVDHIHHDDRFEVAAEMQRKIRKLENFELQFRMRNAQGSHRWVLCRGKIANINSRNEAVLVFGILLDIDQLHKQESKIVEQAMDLNKSLRELEMTHSELKIKSERIREYSFHMSHNIRKPLANLLGLAQLATDGDIDLDASVVYRLSKEMDEMIHNMHKVLGSHLGPMNVEQSTRVAGQSKRSNKK